MTKYSWIAQLFSARKALEGGALIRKKIDVDNNASRLALAREVSCRGASLWSWGDYFLILCGPGDLRRIPIPPDWTSRPKVSPRSLAGMQLASQVKKLLAALRD